jgi:hypothetical protein
MYTSLLISVTSASRNFKAGFIHLDSRHSYEQQDKIYTHELVPLVLKC